MTDKVTPREASASTITLVVHYASLSEVNVSSKGKIGKQTLTVFLFIFMSVCLLICCLHLPCLLLVCCCCCCCYLFVWVSGGWAVTVNTSQKRRGWGSEVRFLSTSENRKRALLLLLIVKPMDRKGGVGGWGVWYRGDFHWKMPTLTRL